MVIYLIHEITLLNSLPCVNKFHDYNVNRYLDYDGWKERLIERFHVPRSSAFYKQQFDTLIMNSSERVIDFAKLL